LSIKELSGPCAASRMRKVEPSKVYRLLYPSVPAIVAASSGGKTSAMPVVSIVSLSNDPPIIALSSSPSHATFRAIAGARCFSVSWLDSEYLRAVEFLGMRSGRDVVDKLLAAGLHHRATGSPPVPVISEASAFLRCSVEEVRTYGDHELVVGLVLEAKADADFDDYWKFKGYRPILYSGLGRPTVDRHHSAVRPP
jgi:flavin reductase (DIM6/NTAB) family NADH-FMN oxidoreductase RutF